MRVGILGGTFDPIHIGHLRLAEEAADACQLDAVLLVPNGQPVWDKGRAITPAVHRLAMTTLAIADNPRLQVSTLETDRPGPSYAVDTARAVRAQFSNLDALYWIIGADMVRDLRHWHDAPALLETCQFLALTRPGSVLPENEQDPVLKGRVTFHPVPGIEVSSSDLRRRVQERRSLRYLTPQTVADYIHAHGLYAQDEPYD